jgi:hypothetical protein
MTNRTLFSDTDENVLAILAQLEHFRKIYPPAIPVNSPVLSAQQIATFVETAYWSSLLASEGRSTSVRIAAVMRKSFTGLPQFLAPVPFNEAQIAKLAPVVPPRGCLLVDPDTMQIFAICRQPLSLDAKITVDVVRPGVVQIGLGVFRTFVVFAGRRTTPVVSAGTDLADSIRTALRIVLPSDFIETQAVWREALALADVARAVRTNGHGGALLFVPDDEDTWSVSIDPFGFRLDVRDGAIPDSIRAELKTTQQAGAALQALWQSTISDADKFALSAKFTSTDFVDRNAIDSIARLAAVDGAVVLMSRARLVGFGAKIAVKAPPPRVAWILPSSERQMVNECELEGLGGMRHQSAARFVGANQKCAALVVSEDGPMSFMSWHAEWDCVLVVKNVDWWC